MKAVVLKEFGPEENLQLAEIPMPEITEHEVLIKVNAFSINPVDAHVRKIPDWWQFVTGSEVKEPYIILGWDIAGVIVQTGKEVTKFKQGDAVYGLVNFLGVGNAYAERSCVKTRES